MTETALPAGLTYVASSSSHSGAVGGYTIAPFSSIAAEPATGLSWTINNLQAGVEVTIKYKATVGATGTLANNGVVAHSSLGSNGTIINVPVTATNTPTYTLYMPIIFKSPPSVTLNAIPYTTGASSWALSWTPASQSGVTFEVQEDDNASFSSPTAVTTTSSSPYTRTGASFTTGTLYYRVRAVQNGASGAWSNTQTVSSEYYDTFTSNTGWEIRRNSSSSGSRTFTNGNLQVKTDDPWSNVIVSPLVKAPGSNYTITTNALMHQRQDRHHFGIIFGGKHASSGCSGLSTSCFVEFYMLDVQYRDVPGNSLYDPAVFEYKLERVTYGSSGFNRNAITNWKSTGSAVTDAHEWGINVDTDGDFEISINGSVKVTGTVDNASLLNDGYYGVIVMADPNGSARTDFEDFRVKAD